jgi:Porin PorA
VRGVVTKLLVFVGAFLLATAALALFYAPDKVKRTPLDVDTITRLTGEAQLYDGTALVTTPVKATSTTHSDSELSTDDVVLFQSSSCLVKDPDGQAPDCVSADDPDNRLVSAGTEVFATDRVTALAVNDFENLPADAEPREGLTNKWPFDVEQKTYPYWDGLIGQPVDAVFQGTEAIDSLETYKFLVSVKDGDIEITDGVLGKYSTEKTIWVDPVTGSIIDQSESQTRVQADNNQTILQLDFSFTDATVAANVDDAKANGSKLQLLTKTVPLIAGIVGLLALIGGLIMWRTAPAREDEAPQNATLDELTNSRRRP